MPISERIDEPLPSHLYMITSLRCLGLHTSRDTPIHFENSKNSIRFVILEFLLS